MTDVTLMALLGLVAIIAGTLILLGLIYLISFPIARFLNYGIYKFKHFHLKRYSWMIKIEKGINHLQTANGKINE